jgi:hypothetical protein
MLLSAFLLKKENVTCREGYKRNNIIASLDRRGRIVKP